ncbi:MAG: peptide deformylase, partial [Clostridiales bacterium]|nr:peptide deformylase [Clostridiales bacterium]
GCLSVPGIKGQVTRPAEITVEGLNRDGKKIRMKASGLLARAICHEIDHLDGILFVDKTIPEDIDS